MNRCPFTHNFSYDSITKLFPEGRFLLQIILLTLLGSFPLMTPAQANESNIDIVDSWVEDGFLFHVAFEAEPSNAKCALNGEGLIEFEVAYVAQTYSGYNSAFGVAKWYPASKADNWIETQGQAIGSSALCTTFSPCRIQEVNIVNAWCPITDGPLYSEFDEIWGNTW